MDHNQAHPSHTHSGYILINANLLIGFNFEKINVEKKPKKNHLLQTSAGLFKKANTLCGVDIAMIFDFSPAQEAFSSGHPNIGSIMDRFLTGNPSPSSPDTHRLVETQFWLCIWDLLSHHIPIWKKL